MFGYEFYMQILTTFQSAVEAFQGRETIYQGHGKPSALDSWSKLRCWALCTLGLPRQRGGKESTASAGDAGLIPGSRRPAGEGNGNPLYCSCPGNRMDGGAGGLQSVGFCDGDTAEHTCTHVHDHLILQPYHSHSTFRTPVEMALPGNFSTRGVGVACIGTEALRPIERPTAASKVSRWSSY